MLVGVVSVLDSVLVEVEDVEEETTAAEDDDEGGKRFKIEEHKRTTASLFRSAIQRPFLEKKERGKGER